MILLTGASGFFGKIAFRVLKETDSVVGLCHTNSYDGTFTPIDLTSVDDVERVLEAERPEIVVHSAAIRDPDACESQPGLAEALHVRCTAQLAAWCTARNATLVYISTDYVFDGAHPPYREDAAPSALSVYGRTKAAGEVAARQSPRHIVVRMPLQYGFSRAQDDAFVLKVLAALRGGAALEIDNVQARYPTLSDDVAAAIAGLLARDYCGTIHVSGPTRATRLEMWRMIAETFGLPHAQIKAAPEAVRAAAARPPDSRLNTSRYSHTGLPAFHTFAAGLQVVRSQMEAAGYDWNAS